MLINSYRFAIVLPESDPYFRYVTLLLKGDGTNNSTTIIDQSNYHRGMIVANNGKISTTQNKFGGSSLNAPTNTDNIHLGARSLDFPFSGVFTLEFWIYLPTALATTGFMMSDVTSTKASYIDITTSGVIGLTAASTRSAGTISTGVWTHIAFSQDGTNSYTFKNGILISSGTGLWKQSTIPFPEKKLGIFKTEFSGVNGFIDDLRWTRGICRYKSTFSPPGELPFYEDYDQYYNNVVLLLSGDGTNGSTVFLDSSPLKRTLTTIGTASISTSQSKAGGSSVFSPDNSANISATYASNDFQLDGVFTIEFWIQLTSTPTASQYFLTDILSPGAAYFTINSSAVISMTANATATFGTLLLNTWHHVAVSQTTTEFFAFFDGNLVSTSSTSLFKDNTVNKVLGILKSGSNGFSGYIDELRWTKNVARYTGKFIPRTTSYITTYPIEHTYGDYTSHLLHFDAIAITRVYRDSSSYDVINPETGTNDISLTRFINGISSADFTNGGSMDITHSQAVDFKNNKFTIEGYFQSIASTDALLIKKGTSAFPAISLEVKTISTFRSMRLTASLNGTTLAVDISGTPTAHQWFLNTWHHYAIVNDGINLKVYLDGNSIISTTSTGSLVTNTGAAFKLSPFFYHDEFQILNGISKYNSNFVPVSYNFNPIDLYSNANTVLLHFEGFSNSTTFDDSNYNNHFTINGNPINGTTGKFKNCLVCDGVGDWVELSTTSNDAVNFKTSDFTVECWINTASNNKVIMDHLIADNTSGSWLLALNASGFIIWKTYISGVETILATGNTAVNNSTWNHIAINRLNGILSIYTNGVLNVSITDNTDYIGTSIIKFAIGAQVNVRNAALDFNGSIDEVRISKVSRYTGNFLPPTAPGLGRVDPYFDHVALLMKFQAPGFTDHSTNCHVSTLVGGPTISTTQSKFGGSSGSFLTNGMRVDMAGSTALRLAGAFTIEFWIFLSSAPAVNQYYVSSWVTGTTTPIHFFCSSIGTINVNCFGTNLGNSDALSANTWYFISLSRDSSNTFRCHLNGTQWAGATVSGSQTSNHKFIVGGHGDGVTGHGNCYVDDLRVTIGKDRYAGSYTLDPSPFPIRGPY